MSAVAVALIALLGLAIVCFPALASGAAASGEITRAEANAAWTEGSFAGSVRWGNCELPDARPLTPFPGEGPPGTSLPSKTFGRCQITPYATVAPGEDPAECWAEARQWPHSTGSQVLAWEGATATIAGSRTFDVSSVALSGTPGQLLCLSVLEIREDPSPCAYQPGVICIQVIWFVPTYRVAAAAVLVGESEAEESSDPEAEEEQEGLDEDEIAEQGQSAVPGLVSPPYAGPGATDALGPPPVGAQQRRCTRVHSHRSHKKGKRKHRGHRSHKKCVPAPPG
jgi:hypothetical protein